MGEACYLYVSRDRKVGIMCHHTNLAGERVPSTSNRQTVFLIGRSASAGTTAAATAGAAIVNTFNLDIAVL